VKRRPRGVQPKGVPGLLKRKKMNISPGGRGGGGLGPGVGKDDKKGGPFSKKTRGVWLSVGKR